MAEGLSRKPDVDPSQGTERGQRPARTPDAGFVKFAGRAAMPAERTQRAAREAGRLAVRKPGR